MSLHTENIAEIVAGLTQPQKSISPKYFYDERGSQLFDVRCSSNPDIIVTAHSVRRAAERLLRSVFP